MQLRGILCLTSPRSGCWPEPQGSQGPARAGSPSELSVVVGSALIFRGGLAALSSCPQGRLHRAAALVGAGQLETAREGARDGRHSPDGTIWEVTCAPVCPLEVSHEAQPTLKGRTHTRLWCQEVASDPTVPVSALAFAVGASSGSHPTAVSQGRWWSSGQAQVQ